MFKIWAGNQKRSRPETWRKQRFAVSYKEQAPVLPITMNLAPAISTCFIEAIVNIPVFGPRRSATSHEDYNNPVWTAKQLITSRWIKLHTPRRKTTVIVDPIRCLYAKEFNVKPPSKTFMAPTNVRLKEQLACPVQPSCQVIQMNEVLREGGKLVDKTVESSKRRRSSAIIEVNRRW